MTETDISKVLIEGEYATIMGIKYKRVKEPKPTTLYDALIDDFDVNDCEIICDIVEKWLPPEHDTNSYKWNECLKLIRENLR